MEASSLIGISLAIIALGYIAYSFASFAQDYGMNFVRALPYVFPTIVILLFVGVLVFRAGVGIEQQIQVNATQTEQVAQVEVPVHKVSATVQQATEQKNNPFNYLIPGWFGLLLTLLLVFTLVGDYEGLGSIVLFLFVASFLLIFSAMFGVGVWDLAKRTTGAEEPQTQQESHSPFVPQVDKDKFLYL